MCQLFKPYDVADMVVGGISNLSRLLDLVGNRRLVDVQVFYSTICAAVETLTCD